MSDVSDIDVLSGLELHTPVYQDRTGEVRMHGHKPQRFTAKLRVLVPSSVYVIEVVPDGMLGWKPGQILIRNLELTERVKGKGVAYDDQVFMRYDNLFDAWRAMSRLNPRYRGKEIPDMDACLTNTDRLTELAWELKPTTSDVGVQYQLTAHAVAQKMGRPRNAHKKHALTKTQKAMRMQDARGRFNAGRLPLMHLSIDVALWKRIRDARGIGHRMDFRAAVLELFIAKLVDATTTAERDLKHLLRKNGLFYRVRKPSEVRRAAQTLSQSSAQLERLIVRPFSHVFQNCVLDMRSAVTFMNKAADDRDPGQLDHAKVALNRAYRSLELLKGSFILQEALATVASIVYQRKEMSDATASDLLDTLFSLDYLSAKTDEFTHEAFEHGFRTPILERVQEHAQNVVKKLKQKELGYTKAVRNALKLAVAPF